MVPSLTKTLGLGVTSFALTIGGALVFSSGVKKLQLDEIRSPSRSLLNTAADSCEYIDAYKYSLSLPAGFKQMEANPLLTHYLQSFFNSVPFQLERQILRVGTGKKEVTNEEIDEMKFDRIGVDEVYSFKLVDRTNEEALFKWGAGEFHGLTWFGLQLYQEDGQSHVDILFGSGLPGTGPLVNALMPFHLLYSQVLIKCAALRMEHALAQR